MAYICMLIAVFIFAVLYWIGDEPAESIYGGYIDDSQNFYIWDE